MKKLILMVMSLLVTLGALAEDVKVTSPDGRLVVNISFDKTSVPPCFFTFSR